MDSVPRIRAKELFLAALEEPPERRREFIRASSQGNDALRTAVEELLESHRRAEVIEGWLPASPRAEDGLRPGDTLGEYVLLAELGSGAGGKVFRARQESLEREVALKVPTAGRFASQEEVARFRREAEAVARFDHPNIVPIYEVGEADGRHYFTMKLVEGGSVATRAAEFRAPEDAARLVEVVGRAVHHAHQRGVLHRDLKPSNILLAQNGTPFVADFGIAARLGGSDGEVPLAGTPSYMAPEQAVAGGEPTTASDVWALGCVLYELVTGHPPFHGSDVLATMRNARESPAPPLFLPEGAPRLARGRRADLEAIVHRCLEKDPTARYASTRALADELRRWLSFQPVLARERTLPERLRLQSQRHPLVATLIAALGLLVLALAVGAPLISIELGVRLKRAEEAEDVARARLRSALLAQAEATRRSAEPGRRARSLAHLAEAAHIAPGGDLRDEAIRCLTLLDVETRSSIDLGAERGGQLGAPLAIDAGGRAALVARADGGVSVLDLDTGAERATISPRRDRYWWGTLVPRSTLVVLKRHGDSIRDDPALVLHDYAAGSDLREWAERTQNSRATSDALGERLALSFDDRTIEVCDVRSGERLWRTGLEGVASDLEFSPDGRFLFAATGRARSVVRAELATGELTELAVDLPYTTLELAVSPDGGHLAVGLLGAHGVVIDTRGGGVVAELRGHAAEVAQVAFIERDVVATGSWDGTTRLWDAVSGRALLVWPARLVVGARPGLGLVVAHVEERLDVLQLVRPRVVRVLDGHPGKSPHALAAAPDGAWLATGATDGLRLWDHATGALLARVALQEVKGLAVDAAGHWIYASGAHGLARVSAVDLIRNGTATPEVLLESETLALALADDGRTLAVVRPLDKVTLFVLEEGTLPRVVRTLRAPGRVDLMDFSPDGRLLAVGAWRGHGVRVFEAATGEVSWDWLSDQAQVTVEFDARGDRLLAAVPDALYVHDLALDGREPMDASRTRRLPISAPRALDTAGAIAADPAGRWLAVITNRDQVELRDAATLEVHARLALEDAPYQSVEFVPGTSLLATGTTDGRAVVWDLARLEVELSGLGLALE
jgi:serine/threonine protein kinase/WD40 repeat protein